MSTQSATDFLIRTVLDEAFRELALNDPHHALEEYDLADREREILLANDARLLELLGQPVEQTDSPSSHQLRRSITPPPSPPPTLPEVKILLRLTPFVATDAASNSKLSYEASLHPWPHNPAPNVGNAPPDPEPAPADAPPAVQWMIRIAPTVVATHEAGTEVSYSASIHPFTAESGEPQPSPQHPIAQPANPPWNHHTESAAARVAARNVRQCDPTERYENLLDLIRALQTGDECD